MQFFTRFLVCCLALCWTVLAVTSVAAETKQILMIAGRPSHGFGSHEHYAGLKVLQEALLSSSEGIETTVVRGWPEDQSLIENADSIVIYSDGGRGHVAIKHLDTIREKMNNGCGL